MKSGKKSQLQQGRWKNIPPVTYVTTSLSTKRWTTRYLHTTIYDWFHSTLLYSIITLLLKNKLYTNSWNYNIYLLIYWRHPALNGNSSEERTAVACQKVNKLVNKGSNFTNLYNSLSFSTYEFILKCRCKTLDVFNFRPCTTYTRKHTEHYK